MVSKRALASTRKSLRVENFSALSHAEIELKQLTILTGPQASGKSLLCKLCYFLQDIDEEMFRSIADGASFNEFRRGLAVRFTEWFPPSAWGHGPFSILYSTQKFDLEVTRAGSRSRLRNEAVVHFSDAFEKFYIDFAAISESAKKKTSRDDGVFIRPELNWQLRSDFLKRMNAAFSGSLVAEQTYIPASRAFFTTFGKAMSAFEHGQLLDPITKSFGRLYIALVDRMRHGFPITYDFARSAQSSGVKYRHRTMAQVFGGRPRMDRNELVIEAEDGRVIPLFALSSGQQELLPLWITLDYFESSIDYTEEIVGPKVLYIEEPEAHLFPDAQTAIVDVLASLLRKPNTASQMVLTTHSPYILSKANNHLLAGKLGFRKRTARQQEVARVIPKSRWLSHEDVACYGLDAGSLVNLVGKDGLISTDYIDSVSQEVIEEFSALVDVGL